MTRTKKMFRPWISVLSAALLLAGCSSIIDLPGGGEAPALYELHALAGPGGQPSRNWVLFIEAPAVPGALATDQVAVRVGQRRLEYLAGARWSDRTPNLLARYLEESIENSGLVTVVGASTVEITGDYRLKIDIRDFSADVGSEGPTKVTVRFGALILRSAPAEIVGRKQFAATAEARGRRADALIAAFNDALDQTATDLLVWLAELPDTGGK